MRTAIGTFNLPKWFENGFAGVVEAVKVADDVGIDIVAISEHLAMSESTDAYPYGRAPIDPRTPFAEPMVHLGALSGATKSIRLGTCILISPLRPAVLLAKQIATLDFLSGGRAHMAFGIGWLKEEFDACGMPWEDRFEHMIEQVQACRNLWSEAPATFHGKFINFDRMYSLPFPTQGARIPISFGVRGTERNIERLAEHGVGWHPMERDPGKLAEPIRQLRAKYQEYGRRADELDVWVYANVLMDDKGRPDIDRALAQIPQYAEIGVTTLQFYPPAYADSPKDLPRVLERIVRAAKG